MGAWRRAVVGLASAGLLAGALAGAPGAFAAPDADNPPPRPPGVSAGRWAAMFGPTPAEWAPQGTVVAAAGYQPWRDTFRFFNYGATLNRNAYLGYDDVEPDQLTPALMRQMFGPEVCTRVAAGRCTLHPVAQSFMDSANDMMKGGHCFGFAAFDQLLFNRALDRSRFGGSVRISDLPLSSKVQRQLAYWWATQLVVDPDATLFRPPTDLVDLLVEGLDTGRLPYVLVFFISDEHGNRIGGHAVTPYAVHDRGDGDYDIAVYDNNFPLRARAIHVDGASNSFEYEVSPAVDGRPALMARGDATDLQLALLPVDDLRGTFDCPFCSADSDIVVSVTSEAGGVPAGTRVAVVGQDGRPIPGVEERTMPSPPEPGRQLVPAFEVPARTPFRVVVDATKATAGETVTITAIDRRTSLSVQDLRVRKGTRTRADFDPHRGTASVITSRRSQADLRVGLDRAGFDYQIDLISVAQGGGDPIAAQVKRGKGRVVLVPSANRKSTGVLKVTRTAAKHRTATRAAGLVLRPKDRVRVDYTSWKPGQALKVTVLRPGKGAIRVPTS